MERNLRFKTRPILRTYSVVHGLLVMCEREESPGSLLLGWVEEKKERKKFVQIELHAQNKIRTKKYPKLQILPRFSAIFNLFAKIQSFFLQASVFRFICVF